MHRFFIFVLRELNDLPAFRDSPPRVLCVKADDMAAAINAVTKLQWTLNNYKVLHVHMFEANEES